MHKHTAPFGATAAAVMLYGTVAILAQRATPEQVPSFHSGVEAVSVEVGVVDRQGQPVRDLNAADFTVSVAGLPRRVISAEFIDADASGADLATPPDAASVSTNEHTGVGRMVMFVVDQNTLDIGSARQVARSSARLFNGLTFADRSALVLLPVGRGIAFTSAHSTVRDALQNVVGMAGNRTIWEYGSLADARDIANSNSMALRMLEQRECGNSTLSASSGGGGGGGGGGSSAPSSDPAPASPPGSGDSGGNTGGTGSPAQGGSGQSGSGSRGGGSSASGLGGFGSSSCSRNLQMQAEAAWRMTQATSLSSVASMRQMLSGLAKVPGDKTIILISGGWPLDERDETTLMAQVAVEAAAVRATIHTIFVPTSPFSADRRGIVQAASRDQYIHLGPLETLAGMTGGGTFRAEVSADSAFERLRRELGGFYRLGIEKDPADAGARNRSMKVQVTRGGLTIRARGLFDIRTYEDRDWAARMASALESPVPASGLGLRVTSYITADPDDSRRLKIVLAGEATRMQPGEATFQVLVRDLDGRSVISGEKRLGETETDALPFSAEIPVAAGSYIVRLAVMDSTGRVGSVDHRVEALPILMGGLTASRPLLIRVPAGTTAEPRVAFGELRRDERLALQVDLEGETDRMAGAGVIFEIASSADGPAMVRSPAAISRGPREGSALAQAVADLRVLPKGEYVVRAKVTSGDEILGELRRPFVVVEAPAAMAESVRVPGDGREGAANVAPRLNVRGSIPRFAVDQVLRPAVLTGFLERISARPDAARPEIRELLERARSGGAGELDVPDGLARSAAVPAFLKGLTLLSQKKFELAATSFRSAMSMSADFYPAMVYLGACYAAGGKDKEAAGAWRTALIKEGDTVAVHILLADALLRQDRGDLAVQAIERARARWPEDDSLNRRFAVATLLAGRYADGLQAVETLVGRGSEDEPSLALALFVLYEALEKGRPVQDADQDRARMIRLADRYRAQGGPSLALVDAWTAAATQKR